MGCDRIATLVYAVPYDISIHAARVGCDLKAYLPTNPAAYFNPRSPSGLRLKQTGAANFTWVGISIHAARVGCDCCAYFAQCFYFAYFNPRSPSGLRLAFA